MSLQRANITWTAKQIRGMVNNEIVSFDNVVQRSFVWEWRRMTDLIESMMLGYPTNYIYAKRSTDEAKTAGKSRSDKVYDVLDGQQRLTTVTRFLNDEFALAELPPVTYFDEAVGVEMETDVTGMKFSELPEALQDTIKDTQFTVIYFDNLTANEEKELFKRLNAGKPLTGKNKLLCNCTDLEGILDAGKHPIFSEMLTDKKLANKEQATYIMKTYTMLHEEVENISFASKDLNKIAESTVLDDEEAKEIANLYSFMQDVHAELISREAKEIAKKFYTELHFISLVPFINTAIENEIESPLVADWIAQFFDTKTPDETQKSYFSNCLSGSASNRTIKERHKALEESFNTFFA